MILILILLLLLDSIYITIQLNRVKDVYFNIQKSSLVVKPLGAIVCYAFLTFLLYYFIISKKKRTVDAFLLGLCVYGVYDSTTYAIITDFPASLAITDTIWGGVLFGLTTFIYYKIHLFMKK